MEIVSLQDLTENGYKIKININVKEILKVFEGLI